MNRRRFLAATVALASTGAANAQIGGDPLHEDHPLRAAWAAWKTHYMSPEGRVIDDFQNNDSHSEGQSYGLTFAALFEDRETFDRIDAWTQENLLVRGDALMAWRWHHDKEPRVSDPNNASDGDLLYAWALLVQSQRDGRAELATRATAIVDDILRVCVAANPAMSGTSLLLPGEHGFNGDDGPVLNPSYYIPHAMRDLAEALDRPLLAELATTGEALIDSLATSGPAPDWTAIAAEGPLPPPSRFSQVSGYEAIRVPIYAMWSRRAESPAVGNYAAAAAAGTTNAAVPVVMQPATGAVVESSSHAGYRAVAALATCASSGAIGSTMPAFTTDQPYYPASLHLMTLLAQLHAYPRCVPI